MTVIYVLDTETTTTTFRPVPNGHVVEIGISKVDLESHTVEPFFSEILTVKKMVKGKKKIDIDMYTRLAQRFDTVIKSVESRLVKARIQPRSP